MEQADYRNEKEEEEKEREMEEIARLGKEAVHKANII